jgi:hypothetical protein
MQRHGLKLALKSAIRNVNTERRPATPDAQLGVSAMAIVEPLDHPYHNGVVIWL